MERIADLEGADPLSLDPPLNDVIDADALDELCASPLGDLNVTFEYRDYLLTVTADGTVSVRRSTYDTATVESPQRSIRAFSD